MRIGMVRLDEFISPDGRFPVSDLPGLELGGYFLSEGRYFFKQVVDVGVEGQ